MAKGKIPEVREAICNIAVDVWGISNFLPKNAKSSGIILLNLSIQWSCLF